MFQSLNMTFEVDSKFKQYEKELRGIFDSFDESGKDFVIGDRNRIKLFDLDGHTINVKSFKKPHLVNQIVYKYFRKTKARRSFEFAEILMEKGIGTPHPIAFQENYEGMGLGRSFYASIHQSYDLTYRELVEIPDYPDHDNILRQFSRFCYKMHQLGIEFKDHSPGNTLIRQKENGEYAFFLVDLNRMNFHQNMSLDLRMNNLSRLTPKKEMVEVMADEYAKASGENSQQLFELMWHYTQSFQERFHRKKRLKNKIKSQFKKQ